MSDEMTLTLIWDITGAKLGVRQETDCSAPEWYVTLTGDLLRNLVSGCFLTSVYTS